MPEEQGRETAHLRWGARTHPPRRSGIPKFPLHCEPVMKNPRLRSWLRQVAVVLGALLVLAVAGALVDGWRAFGQQASGARRARVEKSPQWSGGHFVNPQPMVE